MFVLYGSIAVWVASSVIYHLAQKTLSSENSFFGILAATYAVAMLISLAGLYLQTGKIELDGVISLKNWPIAVLGVAIVGIEIGVLMTYHAGASISILPLLSNGMVMACLVPIGVIFFREHINMYSIVGMLMIIGGVWVVSSSQSV
jgi:uncharacterized membrane protein